MAEELRDGVDNLSLPELLETLSVKPDGIPRVLGGGPFLLSRDAAGLALHATPDAKAAPTRVDFSDPTLQYRLRTSGRQQGLGKAIGLDKVKAGREIFVVDATAGLGKDSLVLAHLGCRVLMLEQSPIVHALLADGLQRGQELMALQPVLARMELQKAEARQWLAKADQRNQQVDVVYLDPMFPPRDKSAKVKKDIALLHALLGSEADLASLVEAARKVAKYRVVVKRPDGKLPAGVPEPTLWIGSKPAAFAVYVNSSLANMP